MEITITPNPCLILEAASLVFGYVNHFPASQMTCADPYAITPQAVEEMMALACDGLDPEDKELLFYFEHEAIDGKKETCIAFSLLNSRSKLEYCEVWDYIAAQKLDWSKQQKPYRILSLDDNALSIIEADNYTSFTDEVENLPVSARYQKKLIEVFMDTAYHLDRLGQLLEPVAERMKPLLAPWVEGTEPRRMEWLQFLSQENAKEIVLKRVNCPDQELQRTIVTMRYLFPTVGTGTLRVTEKELAFHMGVAVRPAPEQSVSEKELMPNEYNVFRLISSPDCVAVLRAVTRKEKSIQELAQELDMNPGSVFRHVNNLYSAHLLNLKIIHRRNYYTASLEQLKKLTDHLLSYLGWME